MEAVGHLDELDMLLCECGCTLQIVAVWEAHEERIEPQSPAAFGLAALEMELEDLEPLVGEWATSATLPGSEPKRVVSGRTTFAWLERGGYLVQHAAADDPAFPVGVMVIGPV